MKVLLVAEGQHELHGALKHLIQRLHSNATAWNFEARTIRDRSFRLHPGKGGRFTKIALAFAREAERGGYSAIILVSDEDGDLSRHEQFAEAQSSLEITIRRAFGVAVRSFDAWIVADPQACSTICNRLVESPKSPERLTNPKQDCRNLMHEARFEGSVQEFYAAIAQQSRPEFLIKVCPTGFGTFARRVRDIQTG